MHESAITHNFPIQACKNDIEMQAYKGDDKEKKEALRRQKKSGLHNLLKEMKTDDIMLPVYTNCNYFTIYFCFLYNMHRKALLSNETYQNTFEK